MSRAPPDNGGNPAIIWGGFANKCLQDGTNPELLRSHGNVSNEGTHNESTDHSVWPDRPCRLRNGRRCWPRYAKRGPDYQPGSAASTNRKVRSCRAGVIWHTLLSSCITSNRCTLPAKSGARHGHSISGTRKTASRFCATCANSARPRKPCRRWRPALRGCRGCAHAAVSGQ